MRRPIFAISLFFSVSIMMMLMVFIYASMANNTLAYTTSTINPTTTTTTNTSFLDNVETKKVRVGDIDIAYKIFGKGEPLFLIPGFSMTMNM